MSNAVAAFHYLQESILNSLNTAMPAKVLSFDSVTCTAKIQPLYKVQENNEMKSRAVLEGVPVLKQRYKVHDNRAIKISTDAGRHGQMSGDGAHNHAELTFGESVDMIPDLRPGDTVFVVFSQNALDEAAKGNEAEPAGRRFSVTDAVIVGVF